MPDYFVAFKVHTVRTVFFSSDKPLTKEELEAMGRDEISQHDDVLEIEKVLNIETYPSKNEPDPFLQDFKKECEDNG